MKKVMAVGASAALVCGMAVVGSGTAFAKSDFKKVSVPSSVTAGQMFTVKCKVSKAWAGGEAFVLEKGATVNAKRTIGANGDCSMRLMLLAKGKRKIQVRVAEGDSVGASKWMKITVK